mmetsp:Transcript_9129/g.22393  ORF Transcript_9129/g.22393 Transcript_9129/m.22393 type:complete len:353 (-) Transcript_9129:307-1365(-)
MAVMVAPIVENPPQVEIVTCLELLWQWIEEAAFDGHCAVGQALGSEPIVRCHHGGRLVEQKTSGIGIMRQHLCHNHTFAPSYIAEDEVRVASRPVDAAGEGVLGQQAVLQQLGHRCLCPVECVPLCGLLQHVLELLFPIDLHPPTIARLHRIDDSMPGSHPVRPRQKEHRRPGAPRVVRPQHLATRRQDILVSLFGEEAHLYSGVHEPLQVARLDARHHTAVNQPLGDLIYRRWLPHRPHDVADGQLRDSIDDDALHPDASQHGHPHLRRRHLSSETVGEFEQWHADAIDGPRQQRLRVGRPHRSRRPRWRQQHHPSDDRHCGWQKEHQHPAPPCRLVLRRAAADSVAKPES